jgi:hypothetical protein
LRRLFQGAFRLDPKPPNERPAFPQRHRPDVRVAGLPRCILKKPLKPCAALGLIEGERSA